MHLSLSCSHTVNLEGRWCVVIILDILYPIHYVGGDFLPGCSEMHYKQSDACICRFHVHILWFPCDIKMCKGEEKETTYRCGIKTCKKYKNYYFKVKDKNKFCNWDTSWK